MSENLALQKIAPLIHVVRGERVILASDLAQVYGVPTKRLNEQVKRNAERFPEDFAFRLTKEETAGLISQNAILSSRSQNATLKRGQNIKYLPYAFTEHGAIMAANVLNSKQAVEMSVFVVRAFVKLRETLVGHKELSAKIDELDRKVGTHDKAIASIIAAIRQLTAPQTRKPRAIGFRPKRDGEKVPASKQRSQHARKK
jgi:hypothetical protein